MRPVPLLWVGLAVTVSACGDPNLLLPANFFNEVDTVTVYALTDTPVWRPSAYAMTDGLTVRLDQTNSADFAFDIYPDSQPALLPGAVVGQPSQRGLNPGLLRANAPFDSLVIAVVSGYQTNDTVHAEVGSVFYARANIIPTCFLGVPPYAKIEVLAVDYTERSMQFRILVNRNCGYKGLEPGIPER
jgi:hypothetical protein